MKSRFLSGALLGAQLACVAGFLDVCQVLDGYPYHRDYGIFLNHFLLHVFVGGLVGAGVGLALPLVSHRRHRENYPFLHLAVAQIAVGIVFVQTWTLWTATGSPALSALGGVLATGTLVYLTGYLLALSSLGWRIGFLFTPAASVGTLGLLLIVAVIGKVSPPQEAPGSIQSPLIETSEKAPHVLLVVLDTVSAKHLGTYGHRRPTSPALDSLASEGVVFENAFATAPWTLPSHASLFTGLHTPSHQTGWQHPRLHDGKSNVASLGNYDTLTLAEELGSRGYESCGVAQKNWLTDRNGLTQGFQRYFDYSIPSAEERLLLPSFAKRVAKKFTKKKTPLDKGGARVVQTTLDWLDDSRQRDQKRPFFLFLNLNEAHGPYDPPAEFLTKFLPDGLTLEDVSAVDHGVASERKKFNVGLRELGPHEKEIQQALYDAEILYQDGLLQTLIQGLRDRDLLENTLVIITADHGEEFGEHKRYGHQLSLTDSLLHVPLILRYPSLLPAGKRVADLASLVDVFPTILDIIERETGEEKKTSAELIALEGFSLVPIALGEKGETRDWIMAHYQNPAAYLAGFPSWNADDPLSFPLAPYLHSISLLRSAHQKYFCFGNGTEAFVDLRTDPQEFGAEFPKFTTTPTETKDFFARQSQYLENLFLTRRELLVGKLGWFRQADHNNHSQSLTTTQLEETGYVGSAQLEFSGSGQLQPPKQVFKP